MTHEAAGKSQFERDMVCGCAAGGVKLPCWWVRVWTRWWTMRGGFDLQRPRSFAHSLGREIPLQILMECVSYNNSLSQGPHHVTRRACRCVCVSIYSLDVTCWTVPCFTGRGHDRGTRRRCLNIVNHLQKESLVPIRTRMQLCPPSIFVVRAQER